MTKDYFAYKMDIIASHIGFCVLVHPDEQLDLVQGGKAALCSTLASSVLCLFHIQYVV